jgi:hypothetical protein
MDILRSLWVKALDCPRRLDDDPGDTIRCSAHHHDSCAIRARARVLTRTGRSEKEPADPRTRHLVAWTGLGVRGAGGY